jgi:hypothetical protein
MLQENTYRTGITHDDHHDDRNIYSTGYWNSQRKPLQAKLRADYLGLPLLLYPTVHSGIFYILFLFAYLFLSTF